MIEEIQSRIEDLKKKVKCLEKSSSLNEEIKLSFIEFSDESFGLVVNVGNYSIYIQHKLYHEIWICIRHIIKLRNNEIHPIFPIFPKADELCQLLWEELRFVKGYYVFDSSLDTLYNDIEKIVSNIRKNSSTLIPILDNSTMRFPDGTMKIKRNSWKSPARIKGICQESSREFIQGIKKSHQPFYDNTPGLFGCNGTYAGYEEKRYYLYFKVIRPSQEDYEPFTFKYEIEDFIRKYLLPKLQRERMSAKLEDEINDKLKSIKIDVVTHDFDEYGAVSQDAIYIPLGFKSWDEYLRFLF